MNITQRLWRMKVKSACVLAKPTVSISCSWAARGLKWACSAGVSSVSGSRLLDLHATGSPSSSAASPPSERSTRVVRASVARRRPRDSDCEFVKMMSWWERSTCFRRTEGFNGFFFPQMVGGHYFNKTRRSRWLDSARSLQTLKLARLLHMALDAKGHLADPPVKPICRRSHDVGCSEQLHAEQTTANPHYMKFTTQRCTQTRFTPRERVSATEPNMPHPVWGENIHSFGC